MSARSSTLFRSLPAIATLVTASWLGTAPSGADSGHDHGTSGKDTPAAPAQQTVVGDGTAFDVAIDLAQDNRARLYLVNRATNEPVPEATVSLQSTAGGEVAFKATAQAGVYEATLKDAGQLPGNVIVQTATDADAIEVAKPPYTGGLTPAPAEAPAEGTAATSAVEGDHGVGKREMAFGIGGVLFGLLLGGGLVAARRGRRSATAVLVAVGAFSASLMDQRAFAHEGHDHGAPTPDSSGDLAGSAVVLAKRSQLLLGLRTFVAKPQPTAGVLQSFGHIVPKPQNDAAIVAPSAGFVRGLRATLGRSVRRGESLATLQSVATIPIESPIDGDVIELEAVEGARYEAGAKLMRVTNRSVLWVDAELFQTQLAQLSDIEGVKVSVEGWPKAIAASIVNAPTPINEETRTAKVFLELAEAPKELRIGSFVRIHFARKARTTGVPVPADAVLNRAGERLVFVKTGPETFEPRSVAVVDAAEPGLLVVTRGLAEGDRVVTTGNYQLLMKAK